MKRNTILTFIMCLATLIGNAQPKFLNKVQKSIVSLNTYDRQGNLLHQGMAFFTGENGEGVADYRTFKGAHKAVVIDDKGKQTDVKFILGADDTYSMVRFTTSTKTTPLSLATAPQPLKSSVWVLAHAGNNQLKSAHPTVETSEMIQEKYAYYGLNTQMDDDMIGAPVFNESGMLVGILHSKIGEKSYVLDIRFQNELTMKAIPGTSASTALSNIFIPRALPSSEQEALVYIYMQSQVASNEAYMDMLNRFIEAYPKNAEGYFRRATPLIDLQRFDEAEADMQKYLSMADNKSQGYYNAASLIFDKLRLQPEPAYAKWTEDVAISYLDQSIAAQSAYPNESERSLNDVRCRALKGELYLNKHDYDNAISSYESLCKDYKPLPTYYYMISLAREGRGDSIEAVIAPIDSALALYGEPLPTEAASYVIRRGQILANADRFREAVLDYNRYSYILQNKVGAVFYYERSQIEVNARMYQQALEDINKAIELAPTVPLYHVEKGAITVRVELYDDCIKACQTAISLDPSIIDAYRIMGYAQLKKGDKTSARQNMQKAIDMGDENAKKIMESEF
ncbi:MAG: hypothetical protein GXY64_09010 [Bacteroidales bacterium]|nr:hypothetical protein [Bacteroidales bacterium]